jgi:hypothetical protein
MAHGFGGRKADKYVVVTTCLRQLSYLMMLLSNFECRALLFEGHLPIFCVCNDCIHQRACMFGEKPLAAHTEASTVEDGRLVLWIAAALDKDESISADILAEAKIVAILLNSQDIHRTAIDVGVHAFLAIVPLFH